MTARKKAPARRSARTLRIRMYNVGFGDAFLITYREGGTERRILVDCGSIKAAPGRSLAGVVADIIADVKDANGRKRIDLVIATHRHRDHVEGFESPSWADVEVGEVWMPWTENPNDPAATRIRNRQGLVAEALVRSLRAQPLTPERSALLDRIALNALRNETAMKTLHDGFRGSPPRRFLSAGANGEPQTRAVAGARGHVLGPSKDESVIKAMDPPSSESYLRLAARFDEAGREEPLQPFRSAWRIPVAEALKNLADFDQDHMRDIRNIGSERDSVMAASIDGAVNNTSLLLVLEIGRAKLLLPGDAQWGIWKMALAHPASVALLESATFLKVGHHGSHNATPKSFVESHLQHGIPAMVSVIPHRRYPDVPRGPLLDKLRALGVKIARSDTAGPLAPIFQRNGTQWIDATIPC